MRASFSIGILPASIHLMHKSNLVCTAQPNNGMHPTADTVNVINSNRAGRRVMPGVMRLLCGAR